MLANIKQLVNDGGVVDGNAAAAAAATAAPIISVKKEFEIKSEPMGASE